VSDSPLPQPTRITRIHAREVFDSRGRPTVEVEVTCANGAQGRAIAPSGASKGQFEAVELRDESHSRLGGRGVRTAVGHVETTIAAALCGLDAVAQQDIDLRLRELDGTSNCARLGGNALVAVSLAVAHAAARARRVQLVEHLHDLWQQLAADLPRDNSRRTKEIGNKMIMPLPMVNMISGGLHAGKNLDFQDFLIIPVGASSYAEALDWIVTIYHQLGEQLHRRGFEGVLVGDEGGYGPKLQRNEQAIEILLAAIEASGYTPGSQIALALDVAATHLRVPRHEPARYELSAAGTGQMTGGQLVDLFGEWSRKYPILSIEDPVDEADESSWKSMTERLSGRLQLIGDDLFVTNPDRFRQLSGAGLANSVLIKVNQIGTLSQTMETMRLALAADYWPVVSARSGETEDATIADLAVATGAGQIKIGSVARSERLAKYNQLLRLEERLGNRGHWLGGSLFSAISSGRG
jgi:enolase